MSTHSHERSSGQKVSALLSLAAGYLDNAPDFVISYCRGLQVGRNPDGLQQLRLAMFTNDLDHMRQMRDRGVFGGEIVNSEEPIHPGQPYTTTPILEEGAGAITAIFRFSTENLFQGIREALDRRDTLSSPVLAINALWQLTTAMPDAMQINSIRTIDSPNGMYQDPARLMAPLWVAIAVADPLDKDVQGFLRDCGSEDDSVKVASDFYGSILETTVIGENDHSMNYRALLDIRLPDTYYR